ncbi:ester cyclase [Streptomyces sp. PSAA01]|uniref:ester cyclase n=1 Tax=Streptomyces sp. PSAA01 TaxID=2912762 RepID=UPI001F005FF5|nr:ester cyclase [Streptomyces sp. PSAA01]MCG0289115.1 ester cyclase [Streptomyces sp. PSAA01]
MAVYSLTEVKVLDGEGAQKYAEIAQSSVAAHGGKFLVLASGAEVAEGDWPQDQLAVIIEFADKKQLHTWYDSAEYAPARKIAATALDRRLVFLDGFAPAAAADPETLVRRFYAAMTTGDVSAAGDYLRDDWQDIPLPPGTPAGIDGYLGTVAFLRSAFPDLDVSLEDVVVSGDRVAVRVLATGTHRGEILGVAPTGRTVAFRAFDFHQIKDGKIASTWHLEDFFGLQLQLGAE